MSWLKLSDDFGDDLGRSGASDAAFRTHTEALLWTMRRETDGHIDGRDVLRFAETTDPSAAIAELVELGLWETQDDGSWQIVHQMDHQPSASLLAQRKKGNAERQRRFRESHAAASSKPHKRQDCKRCEGGGWVFGADGGDYVLDASGNTIKCDHRPERHG